MGSSSYQTGTFFKAVLGLLMYTFLYSILGMTLGLAEHGTGSLESAVWRGFWRALLVAALLLVVRTFAPDAWDKLPFWKYFCAIILSTWLTISLTYWEVVEHSNAKHPIAFLSATTAVISVGGIPIYALVKARGYNLLSFHKHLITHIFVIPTLLIYFVAIYTASWNSTVYAICIFTGLMVCAFGLICANLCDKCVHDELGYIVGIALTCIFAPGMAVRLSRFVEVALVDTDYLIIIVLLTVKIFFGFLTLMINQALDSARSVKRHSIFPPLFPLQLTEDLYISFLYLNERLRAEFAAALLFTILITLIRDSGVIHESWCRYGLGLEDERIALYMAKEYFVSQQNAVCELVASPCVFVVILTEYIFADVKGFFPKFTPNMSGDVREEHLLVYLIVIFAKVPTGYIGWRLFKRRLKKLSKKVGNLTTARPRRANLDETMLSQNAIPLTPRSALGNHKIMPSKKNRPLTRFSRLNPNPNIASNSSPNLNPNRNRNSNAQCSPQKQYRRRSAGNESGQRPKRGQSRSLSGTRTINETEEKKEGFNSQPSTPPTTRSQPASTFVTTRVPNVSLPSVSRTVRGSLPSDVKPPSPATDTAPHTGKILSPTGDIEHFGISRRIRDSLLTNWEDDIATIEIIEGKSLVGKKTSTSSDNKESSRIPTDKTRHSKASPGHTPVSERERKLGTGKKYLSKMFTWRTKQTDATVLTADEIRSKMAERSTARHFTVVEFFQDMLPTGRVEHSTMEYWSRHRAVIIFDLLRLSSSNENACAMMAISGISNFRRTD
ncbi:hypothetical protein AAMO2058_001011800 [Amorphochlora amoebiformis]